jgi:hypothetical protein
MKGTPIPGNGQDLTYEGASKLLASLAVDFEQGRFGLPSPLMLDRANCMLRVAVFLDRLHPHADRIARIVGPKEAAPRDFGGGQR